MSLTNKVVSGRYPLLIGPCWVTSSAEMDPVIVTYSVEFMRWESESRKLLTGTCTPINRANPMRHFAFTVKRTINQKSTEHNDCAHAARTRNVVSRCMITSMKPYGVRHAPAHKISVMK